MSCGLGVRVKILELGLGSGELGSHHTLHYTLHYNTHQGFTTHAHYTLHYNTHHHAPHYTLHYDTHREPLLHDALEEGLTRQLLLLLRFGVRVRVRVRLRIRDRVAFESGSDIVNPNLTQTPIRT